MNEQQLGAEFPLLGCEALLLSTGRLVHWKHRVYLHQELGSLEWVMAGKGPRQQKVWSELVGSAELVREEQGSNSRC